MLSLEFVPRWFNGYSFVVFELISAIILFTISAYSYKCYRFNKNVKNKYLAISFLLMAVAFLAKISTNIVVHYNIVESVKVGLFLFSFESVKSTPLPFIIGYFFFRLLTLLGLYILYLTLSDSKENPFLAIYFIIVTTVFSSLSQHVFYMTSLVLSGLIAKYYYSKYKIKKKKATLSLFGVFLLLSIAQALFIFSVGKHNIYVLSEILQLTGFITLLYVFVRTIKKNAKKK